MKGAVDMTTEQTSGRPGGAVAEVHEKGQELASRAQEQAQEKAQEIRGEAGVRLRDQVDRHSTQAGEQVQAVGSALRRSAEQLRQEGKETPASLVEQVARRAHDLGGYLQATNADRMVGDIERFARQRPWLTGAAGALAGFLASRFVQASSDRRHATHREPGTGTPARQEIAAGGA
jgi:ElaB/YqjD/DUF883 family membrane-anchored ribosome-binding protein